MTNRAELQTLAQELAEVTVEYYALKLHVEASERDHGSALRSDEFELRSAYETMVDVQNRLATCAQRVAEMEY